jgi:hypothetical protein
MDFLDILREKSFLGREFLTWLWYKSEQGGGTIELDGKGVVEVVFLDRMTLDLSDSESPQSVSLKGEHSELREGIAALKEGKKIEEARVTIRSGDHDFTLMLKGTWFSFGSFRTPPVLPPAEQDADEGTEAAFLEKAALVEAGMAAIDDLFLTFLHLRISDRWELAELAAMRKWISGPSR